MISHTTQRFRQLYARLPKDVQKQAQQAYLRFKDNSNHPGLRFKCIQSENNVYSVRVNIDYRALGLLKDDKIIWFWIGSHDDYSRLISQ